MPPSSDKKKFTEKNLIFVKKIMYTSKKILINEGYSGLSMRAIANRMNIHISTIQHYFKNKNQLIEYLFRDIALEFNDKIKGITNSLTDEDPLSRFLNFINTILDEMENEETYILFIELISSAQRLSSGKNMLNKIQSQYLDTIYKLIINITPSISFNEYKNYAQIISMQTQAYLINFSNHNDEQKNKYLRNSLLQYFSSLVTKVQN
ncbi:TetR/AcrR family transcriptional regulator [Acinetobacter sp. V91_7]|uniref:TetR/AcrR family transcriptional regulator n=1 Tax=unclassified Acinetobacter TaxID=196816 RepID=UPI00287E492D|nr:MULTISPECIES: TetR/AcrR family transcriptional regulator [unclassified Acinetobacter]MDS7927983.1 TetR/AcrR family transcriptional regulator [Acinetobacter sp. V102_4]MDS7932491.1 TetR/AcrR family transcriptional regulator [Acinetobacter sp. V91_4B]MDS7961459.1 TetR/AcrR family transcriptional regulator [Acinetobacter sp. V91_7]MDS8025966.1 TetR/AcrR family transcriptional regulator [Acinetobacter sp. V91_13]